MLDPYCYPDCEVLRNQLGIKDKDLLSKAEVDYSTNALHELALSPLCGQYDFAHLCAVHRYIFQDVYQWAGQPRTVPIEKAEAALGYLSIVYAQPSDIVSSARAILQEMTSKDWNVLSLKERTMCFAQTMANLWQVHAFREGNTRTTITFLCQFIQSRGIAMDYTLFQNHAVYTRRALVAACAIFPEGDFRKPQYLHKIVRDSFLLGQSKQ